MKSLWIRSATMALAALFTAAAPAAEEVDFLREVRPILSGHCFKCHGPDKGTRKSGLRLDQREDALKPAKSGMPAIVPGDPDASELVRRILANDPDDRMPPASAKLPLTDAQKEVLQRWITEGAEYTPHWAFIKPAKRPIPEVRAKDWPRNEIDRFILARLEKEGLEPSPRAGKYTLVRRLYLDLIGLPPTPAEADAFVNDPSPDAYERLVDQLLASPHYGERWARRWLDLARYADTNGYEKDRPRSMWPYRDWVIQALNDDMPFDQFTIEQIAGDMLPNATPSQIIATGFHRNTMLNEEGGIDPLEFRFYSMVDRVHVTATTWLGLTMACAQCHTHKYDPIQHTEYYQFMALLNNADEPKFKVPDEEIARERRRIKARIAEMEENLINQFPAEFRANWFIPGAGSFESESGAEGQFLNDGSVLVTGKNPDKDAYTLEFWRLPERFTHLQLEAIPDENEGPGRTGHGNFVLSEIELEVLPAKGEPRQVKFASAQADFSQNGFPAAQAIDGKLGNGWAIAGENTRTHRRVIFALAEPVELGPEDRVRVRLEQQYGGRHTLGRFRLSFGHDPSSPEDLAQRARAHRERRFAEWIAAESARAVKWVPLRPAEARADVPALTIEADGSVFATGDFTKKDTYIVSFQNVPAGVTAIRIEALADERLPRGGPGTVSYEGPEGDFWLSNLKAFAGGEPAAFKAASESFASGANNAAKAIDDDLQSGWSINGGQGQTHNAVFQLAEPFKEKTDLRLELTCEKYYAAALGRFRVWITREDNPRASALPNEARELLLAYKGADGMKRLLESPEAVEDRAALLRHFAQAAPELAPARQEIEKLRDSMPEFATTLVMRERSPEHPRVTHRHHRGEFLQPREVVEPGVPAFLPQLPEGSEKNRLALAKWLVSEENPLTARVVMNRHWDVFFGRGLVRTVQDFGFQGELPSHPALLDWLALEFMRRDWSQKQMHKLIVMSAAYQQSSVVRPDLLERDPENILLARGPRFRLEAELIRDNALTASGLLSPKLGGPSVFPPQPPGVTTEGAYGALQWKVSEGADRYRRGLYTFAKRTTPYAMTLTFDGPSGEACLARRERSNTPLQALTLLNDDVFMECAQALGRWAAGRDHSAETLAVELFRRCLTRPPTDKERAKLVDFYHAQLARLKKGELNPAKILGSGEGASLEEAAAWTAVARVLLNLDETITKS